MNIFELTLLIAALALAYLAGRYLGAAYGLVGWIAGVIVGGGGVIAGWAALSYILRGKSRP